MKFPKVSRPGREGVNSGFRPQDQTEVDRLNNHTPDTQLFIRSEDDLQGFEDQTNLCANCGSKLLYLGRTQIFICGGCHEVSQSQEDSKLKQTNQDLRPFLNHNIMTQITLKIPHFLLAGHLTVSRIRKRIMRLLMIAVELKKLRRKAILMIFR